MKRKGFRTGGFLLIFSCLVSCNGKGFKGATVSNEAPPALPSEPVPPVTEANSIMETAIETSSSQIQVAACREKLSYDPSQILCSLKQNDKKTVWDVTAPWTDYVKSLKNPAAAWISPLAAVENANATFMCPFVPDSDRLIFVSNFTLTEDTDITLEAVIDDIGTVRLWKDADSKQQVYTSMNAPKVDGTIRLSKGFYSIVADGVDVGKGATGMILTIFNPQGGIIRQTEPTAKDWCIFRVKADTDVAAFVNAASLCRSCMVGSRAPGP